MLPSDLLHPNEPLGCPAPSACPSGLPLKRWFHLRLDLRVPHDGGPAELVLQVDGTKVFDGWPDNYIGGLFPLGLAATLDTPGPGLFSMYIDNVVVSEENPL